MSVKTSALTSGKLATGAGFCRNFWRVMHLKLHQCKECQHVNPIKTPKNETPLKIKHKENNRCFLPYPSNDSVLSLKDRKDEEKKIREARAHMKAIMKSIGMCCQNNEVDETFEWRNRQLLGFFQACANHCLEECFSKI